MAKAVLIAIALAALPCTASARTLDGTVIVDGACGKLVVLGIDLSAVCKGTVSSNSWSDGRASFTFMAEPVGKPPVVFTFSGNGRAQVKQSGEVIVQPVDILFSGLGGKPLQDAAVGSCRFGNPYHPPITIACQADTTDGHYEAAFTSSGKAPDRIDRRRQ